MTNGAKLFANGFKVIDGNKAEAPTFEATLPERRAIARFLDFAANDIEFQTAELLRDPKLKPAQRQQHEISSAILLAYVRNLRGGIEQMTPTNQSGPGAA
jgi:hypothetical protein